MSTFEDTVVEGQGAPGRTGNNGAPVSDAVTSDGRPAPRSRGGGMKDAAAPGSMSVASDSMPLNGKAEGAARVLPPSVREKIAALAKASREADEDDDPEEPDEVEVEADDPDEPDDGVATSPAVKEPEKVAAPPSEWEK